HLLKLLLGQGDQGRGVVGDGAGVQRLEQGGLGDERLAGAGRGADQRALLGAEPREQGFFLYRVRRVGQVIEGQRSQGRTRGGRGWGGGHRSVVAAGGRGKGGGERGGVGGRGGAERGGREGESGGAPPRRRGGPRRDRSRMKIVRRSPADVAPPPADDHRGR